MRLSEILSIVHGTPQLMKDSGGDAFAQIDFALGKLTKYADVDVAGSGSLDST